MGKLSAAICQNIKRCHRESKTDNSLYTSQLQMFKRTILCSNCCFCCYVSAQFKIINDVGEECIYSQKLGFGSSYTLLILQNFTFGQNVTHEHVLKHVIASIYVSE